MTRQLEETLNINSRFGNEDEVVSNIQNDVIEIKSKLSSAEKIDFALTSVTGLDEHDHEMDSIASKAMIAYQDAINFGMSCTEQNAGKILDSAASLLKTALEAKDAKVTKKLKMIELMIKKHKLEQDSKSGGNEDAGPGEGFDRNDIIRMIRAQAAVDVKPNGNGK